MFRPRCASLRRVLRSGILPVSSSRLCAVPISVQSLRSPNPLPNHVLLPLVSSRNFSESPATLKNKTKDHFTKELYESIAEGTMDGILMSLEALADKRTDVDVEYSVLLPPIHLRDTTNLENP